MRQLHTLLLRKRAEGPPEDLPEDHFRHTMPPNLLSSFSAIIPHLSFTVYCGNKHRDPPNDSPQ